MPKYLGGRPDDTPPSELDDCPTCTPECLDGPAAACDVCCWPNGTSPDAVCDGACNNH